MTALHSTDSCMTQRDLRYLHSYLLRTVRYGNPGGPTLSCYRTPLSCYVRATQSPVLTARMVLPPGWRYNSQVKPHPMRCPVLTYGCGVQC
eukprot:3910431-Rhodomonas_salina.2